MKKEDRALYRRAIAKWGDCLQMLILIEEMTALQKEICKIYRDYRDVLTNQFVVEADNYNYSGVVDKLADVTIMIEQVILLLDVEGEVEQAKCNKLRRLAQRVYGEGRNHEVD